MVWENLSVLWANYSVLGAGWTVPIMGLIVAIAIAFEKNAGKFDLSRGLVYMMMFMGALTIFGYVPIGLSLIVVAVLFIVIYMYDAIIEGKAKDG